MFPPVDNRSNEESKHLPAVPVAMSVDTNTRDPLTKSTKKEVVFDDITPGSRLLLKSAAELQAVFASEDSLWHQELASCYEQGPILAAAMTGRSGVVLEKDGSDRSIKFQIPGVFESWVTAELLTPEDVSDILNNPDDIKDIDDAVPEKQNEFEEETLCFEQIQVGSIYYLKTADGLQQVFENEDSIWSQEVSGNTTEDTEV